MMVIGFDMRSNIETLVNLDIVLLVADGEEYAAGGVLMLKVVSVIDGGMVTANRLVAMTTPPEFTLLRETMDFC